VLKSALIESGERMTAGDAGLTQLVKTISASGLASIQQVDNLLKSDKKIERKLRDFLKTRTGQGMTAAAMVRMSILLALPKEQAARVFNEVPFRHPGIKLAFQKLLGIEAVTDGSSAT
jgi:hypothetical protein